MQYKIKRSTNNLNFKIMKKVIFLFVCLFTMSMIAVADTDKPIQIGQLPLNAQTFISTYFKNAKVAMAKQETDLFYKSYDVIFTSGDKIEFDKSGDWTEVKCIKDGVPSQIIPQQIRDYVNTNYPDDKILKIERDSKEYEIKLSGRWEIKFDKQFRVIDIDD